MRIRTMKFSKRKTFCQDVLFENKFLDLPLKVRWFYLCLNYVADDDGFTDCSVALAGICNCTKKDLKLLADKGYVILFDSGIVLISHWYVHNKPFRPDRYHETVYLREKSLVELDSEKVYRLKNEEGNVPNDRRNNTQYDRNREAPDDGDIVFRG